MATSVLVLAEIRLLRDGISEFLDRCPNITLVGSSRLADASRALTDAKPDVAVVHVRHPDELRPLSAILALHPATRVVLVGVPGLEAAVAACVTAGVAGFLTEDGSLVELLHVVEAAARDELRCSAAAAGMLLRLVRQRAGALPGCRSESFGRLTRRELEVASMIERHLSNKEIAAALHVALSTVKNHVHNIMSKLEMSDRAQIAAQSGVAGPEAAVVLRAPVY